MKNSFNITEDTSQHNLIYIFVVYIK